MDSKHMRFIVSKFLVLSLLLVTMHSALANEYTQLPIDSYTVMEQVQASETADKNAPKNADMNDDQLPSESITSSECNVCHTAHILLLLAPGELSLGNYGLNINDLGTNLPHPEPVDDIPHPPIILI